MNSMKFYETVGKNMKAYREKKGMTQAQLGERLGVTKNAVYCWENAKTELRLETAKQICTILDITLDDLL